MKPEFKKSEIAFNIFYLSAAVIIGFFLILGKPDHEISWLAGLMAFTLVAGDAFHLVPRIKAAATGKINELQEALGRGKQITSITMSVFYLLLWHLGLAVFSPKISPLWTVAVYTLALTRLILCLLPQNRWSDKNPPPTWALWRNAPFLLQGFLVAGLFFLYRTAVPGLSLVWLAVLLSFIFYLPVVLWATKKPKIGILMLPKSLAYLWLLTICLFL